MDEYNQDTSPPEETQGEDYSGPDRRGSGRGDDRRQTVVDRRSGLDRRRGPGRRRTETRRAAEEGEMTPEQWEFLQAINEYKEVNGRPFPTWSEVLDVFKAIGYRKVAEPTDIE
jgi:hypothetical protein